MTAMTRKQRIEAALNTLNNFYVGEYLDAVSFELVKPSITQIRVAVCILDLIDQLA